MDLETFNPDFVEEIFSRHGAAAVTYSDAGELPILEPRPGEAPLWRDTRICGLFSPSTNFQALKNDLRKSLKVDALPDYHIEDLEDRAWELEWQKGTEPMRFGNRLWVCAGDKAVKDDHAVVLRLDPGLAFGTGTHATTAMCLEWLDQLPLEGRTLLDFGCGSGILAIAALRLGCKSATATDIDPQAITATISNAAVNGVSDRLITAADARQITRQFDVVVANILATPLVELAARIAASVKSGCLLGLSGILSDQVDAVIKAYSPWIEFDDPILRQQGGQEWVRLTGRRVGD